MSQPINNFKLGIFTLCGLAILVGALLAFGARTYFEPTSMFETYIEGDVTGLSVGSPVELRGVNVGKVTRISPFGKEKDNVTTFEVRVSISNPTGELKANMSANAEILLEEKKNVLMAPEAAMIYDKDRSAQVEVPDAKGPNGKKKVSVKLGISNGVKTEILSGLNEKQQVILQ